MRAERRVFSVRETTMYLAYKIDCFVQVRRRDAARSVRIGITLRLVW